MDWGKWSKWSPLESMGKVFEFGWKEIKPFGFLAGSSSEGAVTLKPGMSGAAGESGKDNTPSIDKQQARSLAQQQVQGAMQPINSINGMNQDTSMQLQQSGQEISQRVEAEHAA